MLLHAWPSLLAATPTGVVHLLQFMDLDFAG